MTRWGIVRGVPYSLFLLLLILYCAFDPKYTDNSGNNSDNVTIVIENGSNVEIVEAIVCASDLDDSIHFYEHLKDNELNLKVQGGSNREFTVNGYVSSTWRYTQSFTADIGEDDTTFVITLKQIDGPVPEVPENIALSCCLKISLKLPGMRAVEQTGITFTGKRMIWKI